MDDELVAFQLVAFESGGVPGVVEVAAGGGPCCLSAFK
jgi:hypothetical protein